MDAAAGARALVWATAVGDELVSVPEQAVRTATRVIIVSHRTLAVLRIGLPPVSRLGREYLLWVRSYFGILPSGQAAAGSDSRVSPPFRDTVSGPRTCCSSSVNSDDPDGHDDVVGDHRASPGHDSA